MSRPIGADGYFPASSCAPEHQQSLSSSTIADVVPLNKSLFTLHITGGGA